MKAEYARCCDLHWGGTCMVIPDTGRDANTLVPLDERRAAADRVALKRALRLKLQALGIPSVVIR